MPWSRRRHLLQLILLSAEKQPSKNCCMCRNQSLLGKRAKSDIAPDSVGALLSRFRNDASGVYRAPVKGNIYPDKIVHNVRREKFACGVISNHYSSPAFLSSPTRENYVSPSEILWELNNFGSYPFRLPTELRRRLSMQ